MQAQAVQVLGLAQKLLETALPLFGFNSPQGKDVHDAIEKLGKHVPPGMINQNAQNNALQKLMLQRMQMQGMRPPGAGGPPPPGAGGPPPPGAGGPPPAAPMPPPPGAGAPPMAA
jgi:hypothetical protein